MTDKITISITPKNSRDINTDKSVNQLLHNNMSQSSIIKIFKEMKNLIKQQDDLHSLEIKGKDELIEQQKERISFLEEQIEIAQIHAISNRDRLIHHISRIAVLKQIILDLRYKLKDDSSKVYNLIKTSDIPETEFSDLMNYKMRSYIEGRGIVYLRTNDSGNKICYKIGKSDVYDDRSRAFKNGTPLIYSVCFNALLAETELKQEFNKHFKLVEGTLEYFEGNPLDMMMIFIRTVNQHLITNFYD